MNWNTLLKSEQQKGYFKDILHQIAGERAQGVDIFPSDEEIFTALELTPFEQVKVVILGQDPYHGEGQAHGLSFSVKPGIKVPPSLVNIYKELVTDIDGFNIPNHGCLTPWAQQGVLLLNTVLTVQKANAHSHAKIGWESYTDKVIEILNEQAEDLVFMLWGSHAQKKGKFIDTDKHLVLTSVHPSPLSAYRGFLGCKHFSKANDYLVAHNRTAINWHLNNVDNDVQIELI